MDSLPVKLSLRPAASQDAKQMDCRRLRLERDNKFDELLGHLHTIWGAHPTDEFLLFFTDDEGDLCTVSSHVELIEAARLCGAHLKLIIVKQSAEHIQQDEQPEVDAAAFKAVVQVSQDVAEPPQEPQPQGQEENNLAAEEPLAPVDFAPVQQQERGQAPAAYFGAEQEQELLARAIALSLAEEEKRQASLLVEQEAEQQNEQQDDEFLFVAAPDDEENQRPESPAKPEVQEEIQELPEPPANMELQEAIEGDDAEAVEQHQVPDVKEAHAYAEEKGERTSSEVDFKGVKLWECYWCHLVNAPTDMSCLGCQGHRRSSFDGPSRKPRIPVARGPKPEGIALISHELSAAVDEIKRFVKDAFFYECPEGPWDCDQCGLENTQASLRCASCRNSYPAQHQRMIDEQERVLNQIRHMQDIQFHSQPVVDGVVEELP